MWSFALRRQQYVQRIACLAISAYAELLVYRAGCLRVTEVVHICISASVDMQSGSVLREGAIAVAV